MCTPNLIACSITRPSFSNHKITRILDIYSLLSRGYCICYFIWNYALKHKYIIEVLVVVPFHFRHWWLMSYYSKILSFIVLLGEAYCSLSSFICRFCFNKFLIWQFPFSNSHRNGLSSVLSNTGQTKSCKLAS